MSSPLVGGCVLVVLSVGALAVVYAVSPTTAVLTVWAVGTGALWRAARRRMSDSSATPPPPLSGDVYAGHSNEIDHVQKGPGEGMSIIYPTRTEVNGP